MLTWNFSADRLEEILFLDGFEFDQLVDGDDWAANRWSGRLNTDKDITEGGIWKAALFQICRALKVERLLWIFWPLFVSE